MTRVKICGVTRPGDALLAAELGAAAIGMVFWPESPRAVTLAQAEAVIAALPPFVSAVGVFVNQPALIAEALRSLPLSVIQLHGDEAPDSVPGPAARVIKMIPVRDETAVVAAAAVPSRVTVLLDAHDPIRRGGTGQAIDWSVAARIAATRPTILSGGLTVGNVGAAIEAVRPMAIDVSSGVESAPGRKDPAKLRALFAAVREP